MHIVYFFTEENPSAFNNYNNCVKTMATINRNIVVPITLTVLVIISLFASGQAVRCYQCGSVDDGKGQDNCGAYRKFDKLTNIAIECNSEESHMPGSFCMKLTQQSPKGFIWDGRWRQVIRKCASVADTGVTGVCNWGVYENGVYWEECYCSEDECNVASFVTMSKFALVIPLLVIVRNIF